MIIPEKITINGCVIPILMVKNYYRDTGSYGKLDPCDMIIKIDDSLSDQKKIIIFFHEFLELVKDMYLIADEDFNHICMQPIALALTELVCLKQIDFT
jgi:hypothetical protein